jgi:TolB protein
MNRRCAILLCGSLVVLAASAAQAEWTNRYPKVAGVAHHVYLEGFNLPTFSQGPTDPAPSPDGRTVAFAARGWLWEMDTATRQARRITQDGAVDARPAWSPNGRQIVFVRDSGNDTAVMLLDQASGRIRVLVDSPAMDLDPVFTADGRAVIYSSAEAGDFDLWRVDITTGNKVRLTRDKGQELGPQPVRGDREIAYVAKVDGQTDTLALLSVADGTHRTLRSEGLEPQLRLSASPDGQSLVMTVPDGDRWQLRILDAGGGSSIRLAPAATYPLSPGWGPDGIWFVQPTRDESFALHRVAATGGLSQDMTPVSWDLGERTARVTIRTGQRGAAVPARLSVLDGLGHPASPASGIVYFDGQHGRHFFHSPGAVTVEVPPGTITVQATHGWDGQAVVRRPVRAGEEAVIDIDLPSTGFNAHERGFRSGDLHSHLNYGGPFQLDPEDLVPMMQAEDLDVATPQRANLHTTLVDQRWAGWRRTEAPLIQFSQEVRSHFLGHVGVIGADALFTPWFFGPGYPVYGQAEITNYDALRFARAHGGLGIYVHPVPLADPFPAGGGEPKGLPLELVPDALDGDVDALEIACLWSDEMGTTEVWYRLLNLGLPIAPSGGSDTMHNFHRTMAIGATRVYACPDGPGMTAYLDAVRRGRSFVSTGPMLDLKVAGQAPGGVVAAGVRSVDWTLDAASPTPVETVELLVNGRVVWSSEGLTAAGLRRYSGRIDVPEGGWIAARIHGGPSAWPTQDSYPFAHTAPVWLGRAGSTDPAARRAAAADLERWMDVASKRLAIGYPDEAGVRLKARFETARTTLHTIRSEGN